MVREVIMNMTNVGGPEEDRQKLRTRIMRELCPIDEVATRNGQSTIFDVENIRGAYDREYVDQELPIFQRERGFISYRDGRISLTELGREHYNDPDGSF
jgi:hypothetical protein